jgi:phage/plasmid-associated DNA primase
MSDTLFEIYNVVSYTLTPENEKTPTTSSKLIIKPLEFTNISDLCTELEKKKSYHFRTYLDKKYIVYFDIDGYLNSIMTFNTLLVDYLNEKYNLDLVLSDIKYTNNKKYSHSYHICIPKIYCLNSVNKEICNDLIMNVYQDTIFKKNDTTHILDTSIYSTKKWFRCPNQLKGTTKDKPDVKNTEHIIKNGSMEDFVLSYIPESSIYIEPVINNTNIHMDISPIIHTNNELQPIVHTNNNDLQVKKPLLIDELKQLIDILNPFRSSVFDEWLYVAYAIKHKKGDDGLELFDYFSQKNTNKYDKDEVKTFYNNLKPRTDGTGKTIAHLYYVAKSDNLAEYIKIMNNVKIFKNFNLTSQDVCKYLHYYAPTTFLWKNKELYCFNGKIWKKNDDLLMSQFIGNDLYTLLLDYITCVMNSDNVNISSYVKKVEKLKTSFKKEVIYTSREFYTNDNVEFDNKWNLFGFNNCVYDLITGSFRDYNYNDYVTLTTGYDWREPTQEELDTVNRILKQIQPNDENRRTLLHVIATGLEGRCLEKFIIWNGHGRNGKGLINDLLCIAFGNYVYVAPNQILFEKQTSGANPALANMDKKRYVIVREPAKNNKIDNAAMKAMCGGGTLPARGNYEQDNQKSLHSTMILECNEKPLLKEEPVQAEIDRIIDINFPSYFTDDEKEINESLHIYPCKKEYKDVSFQNIHKYAIIKIIMDAYKDYQQNNYKIYISAEIKQRTTEYLTQSCHILSWFKENYSFVPPDVKAVPPIHINKIFNSFKDLYFCNLTKSEQRLYNLTYFREYFKNNPFYKKFFRDRIQFNNTDYRSVIINHVLISNSCPPELNEDSDADISD